MALHILSHSDPPACSCGTPQVSLPWALNSKWVWVVTVLPVFPASPYFLALTIFSSTPIMYQGISRQSAIMKIYFILNARLGDYLLKDNHKMDVVNNTDLLTTCLLYIKSLCGTHHHVLNKFYSSKSGPYRENESTSTLRQACVKKRDKTEDKHHAQVLDKDGLHQSPSSALVWGALGFRVRCWVNLSSCTLQAQTPLVVHYIKHPIGY